MHYGGMGSVGWPASDSKSVWRAGQRSEKSAAATLENHDELPKFLASGA